MRSRRVVTALVVTLAGLTVSSLLRRFAGRRVAMPVLDAPVLDAPVLAAPVLDAPAHAVPVPGRDAVVLPFARPAAAQVVERPAAPARCGDSGGRTKAGAPCGARATSGGRCHHHPLAA
jgi:hypothetical protein